MFNCSWQKFLGVILILSSLGCSHSYDQSDNDKQNIEPVNLNAADIKPASENGTGGQADACKNRDTRADNEKEFQEVEKSFIAYLEASDKDKQRLIPKLKKSINYIDAHADDCPGYLPYVNIYIKLQLGLLSALPFEDKLDLGVYNYITQRKDLAFLIKDMKQYREGRPSEYVPVSHICSGIFHRKRFRKQKDIVSLVVPLNQLKGKTIVDIGGGGGGLLAELSSDVISNDMGTGRTVLVEIEPSLLEFAKYMGKYDARFNCAEFRLCESHNGVDDPALKNEEADLVCLFDVHNLYDKFNESISEQEKYKRGTDYLIKIKNGMKKDGVLLIYDSESMSCSADTVKLMAENAGLQVEIRSENLDNASIPGAIKYLVVCRKK